jgi:two-component system, OmpR family, response regulator VicR
MKAIIIEDDQSIIDTVGLAFEFRWPDAVLESATSGQEGIELVKRESPDVVILDINLPDISGFSVLKEIRKFSSVPVVILSVRSDDADVFRGLETGADDYLVKPFNYMTLLARIRAVLRRSVEKTSPGEAQSTFSGDRLKIDFIDQKVWLDNSPVKLTPVEYRLLVLLIKNRNKLVTYAQVTEEIWGQTNRQNTKNIWIAIRRLRNKLQDNPPLLILNKHGSGYIFKTR